MPYVIQSEENFDPATIAGGFPSPNPNNYFTDQAYPGYGYDRINRVILYGAGIGPSAQNNGTGHALWSGQNLVANGANYDGTALGNHYTFARPVDLPANVVSYNAYALANTVPSGKGSNTSIRTSTLTSGGSGYGNGTYTMVPLTGGSGTFAFMNCTVSGGVVQSGYTILMSFDYSVSDVLSASNANLGGSGSGLQITVNTVAPLSDGTWRRITEFTVKDGYNGNLCVDPNTGNLYQHANATATGHPGLPCLLYLLRRSANFALEISPMFPYDNTDRHMDLRGLTNNYVYTMQYPNGNPGGTVFVGSPRDIQAAETALDCKVPYFWFNSPFDLNSDDSPTYSIADAFSTNNKYYVMGVVQSGARNYRLYRFDEPSAATPFNQGTVGGGFTNITPWSSGTGPNTNAGNYTTTDSFGTLMSMYYLPATNDLVAINRFYPGDKTSGPTQSDFFWDCTYVHAPDGGSPTFDYHHAFVTGFMDVNWNPLSSSGNTAPANAAYAVVDCQEVNPYFNVTSYEYVDGEMDYTVRRFAFTVLKCNPGDTVVPPSTVITANNNNFMVFVAYKFVYGSAPAVVGSPVSLYPETGWDTQLPLNSDYTGNFTPGSNFVALIIDDTNASATIGGDYYSNAIFDETTSSWWWSGQSHGSWNVANYFFNRANIPDDYFNPTPPFLRLALGVAPPVVPSGPPYVGILGPARQSGRLPTPPGIEITTESGVVLTTEGGTPLVTED